MSLNRVCVSVLVLHAWCCGVGFSALSMEWCRDVRVGE